MSETQAIADVLARFDSLPAVEAESMIGSWSGEIVPTGHRGERALAGLRWAGKDFHDADDVDPIVVFGEDGGREPSGVMGSAQLRMVAYRGVVTATMIYDDHPVLDHFRRVDETTVLGLMDRKGEDAPLAFLLRRPAQP
ncbi:MAG: DUF4334 domain-containing protein [Baekduia sp.]